MKKEKLKIHPPSLNGKIEKLFKNVWFVKGQVKMPMLMPMKISRSMTIIKENDELTLVNTIRLSDDGLKELENSGKIKNIIRIGGYHGRDDAFYKERYKVKIYALKGHVYSKTFDKIPSDPNLGYMNADVELSEGDSLPISNASLYWFHTANPIEAILRLEQDNGIFITGDSLQNTPSPDEFNNFLSKIMMKKMGFFKPFNIGPAWVQFTKVDIKEIRALLNVEFSHVLPGHGDPVIQNAKEKYRPNLEGDIKGCHSK